MMTHDQMNKALDSFTKFWTQTSDSMNTLAKASQKTMEDALQAQQTLADGVSTISKRNQEVMRTWMDDAVATAKEISSTKDMSKAATKQMDWSVKSTSKYLENASEASQVLNKSTSEAQRTLVKSTMNGLNTFKTEGEKAIDAADMQAVLEKTTTTAWWPNTPELNKLFNAEWWMTNTPNFGKQPEETGSKTATTSKDTTSNKAANK